MNNIFWTLGLVLVLNQVSAHAAGPSNTETISTLSAKGDEFNLGPGEAYIYASSGSWSTGNPENCSTPYPYTYSMTTAAGKALHATLLTAFVTGRRVALYINGCLNGKPRVTRADVY